MRLANELPDERALRADILGGPFKLAVHRGRWKIDHVKWPHIFIAVHAADRPSGPMNYQFRFECGGYPSTAVTACLWDAERNVPLPVAQWPGGTSRIPAVFRPDWKEGACLYLPCDRISAQGHEAWRNDHPTLQWNPAKGIVMYLEELHALLNSSDYTGVRGA